MALRSVSIALLLWHLDALTIPLFEYRSSVFPLDVVVVECPRVGWHQIALESAGGPRLLGLVDAAPAPGARGVLCECHARGRATGDVQRVRAVAVGRFLVEALRPAGHPGRLAVGDVGAVVDAAPEDDEVLREAGTEFGLQMFGLHALNSLRLEKGFGSWAREYRPIYDPFEANLGRFVQMDKDFIGRDALAAKYADDGPGASLALLTFAVETDGGQGGYDVIGDEPIWHDGEVVGWVTSGGYAHHSETSVAMGYVPASLAGSDGPWQIEIIGDLKTCQRVEDCLWDPQAERMRL